MYIKADALHISFYICLFCQRQYNQFMFTTKT